MPARTDDSSTLSEAQLCEINGVSQQYRQALVRRNLIRRAPTGGCTLMDALELAAIIALSEVLPTGDVPLAVDQLTGLLGSAVPGNRFDVVYDRQYKRLGVARDDEELREMVVHGRPVSVVALAERLAEIGDAFRRVAGSRRGRRSESSKRGRHANQQL